MYVKSFERLLTDPITANGATESMSNGPGASGATTVVAAASCEGNKVENE